ncbi:MAG: peptidoglycan D,D-transpeptidase FtsI family protein [Armatimonadota bacterium]
MMHIGCAQIARRGNLWAVIAVAAFAYLGLQLFLIQIVGHRQYSRQADEMQDRCWPIEAPRGVIYDRNGNPLALNLKFYSVAADPKLLGKRRAEVAEKLGLLLRGDRKELLQKLDPPKKTRFVKLQDFVDAPAAETLRRLEWQGLIVNTQWRRAYPHGELAGSLLGFVGADRAGLSGIEAALNGELAGKDGEMLVALDGRRPRSRSEIPGRTMVTRQMTPGSGAVLTIDLDLQAIAEEELKKAVENARARGGAAIVMDPETGEILALASQPGFDPNDFGKYPPESWVAHSVVSPYEPGSTFKAITACAAIEEGVMSHGETYNCTGGRQVGRHTIRCAAHGGSGAHGVLDLDKMVVKSCNVGMATVAMALGSDRVYEWVKRFGFGEKTGIELSGESGGIVTRPDTWAQVQLANIGFGQGISVTPIQLLSAYCAIANGGYRVRPRVVKAITHADGETEYLKAPERERIISEATAERMRGILTRVVEEGTGKVARIEGRLVAGKTGTAQKPTPEAGFRSGLYIGSFVGFVPADDPRLAVIVVIDEPHNGYYGAVVAAPAFQAICQRALTQLRIPPSGRSRGAAGVSVAMAKGSDD